jgi:hypothetical protein
MRARSLQNVPGLDPSGTPFERFTQFAKVIAQIPKTEADKEIKKNGSTRPRAKSKPRK